MALSKRLQKVLTFVDENDVIADIGTDHGYLPIACVKAKKAKKVYAVDVNEKPLASAKTNIFHANLQKQIFPILSNGLVFTSNLNETIDKCTISGLGSKTICEILELDSKIIKNYIICSNTELLIIRQWVKKKMYTIKYEEFFLDQKKRYWLIYIDKTKRLKNFFLSKQTLFLGYFDFYKDNSDYQNYLLQELENYQKIIGMLGPMEKKKIKTLTKKIELLKGFLEKWI